MSGVFKYGLVSYDNARPGDPVRYVPANKPGLPGAIKRPRLPTEINAILESITGTQGYCRLKPQLQSARAGAEGGSASGTRIDLPVTAGGRLKIG